MRIRLQFPAAGVGLLLFWLLLNQSLSLGHIVVGSLIAIVGGWALTTLGLPKARMRRPSALLRLLGLVLADIVRSNIAVARIVLGFGKRERRSGFVDIPIDLRNPYGLAMLACIITSTPGTLWVNFDERSGKLTIHVLDLLDESDWPGTIKDRYERLLLAIFA
jgi:multicomponent K+:H+ antiporter subunit E